jgi:hypothetical protein
MDAILEEAREEERLEFLKLLKSGKSLEEIIKEYDGTSPIAAKSDGCCSTGAFWR